MSITFTEIDNYYTFVFTNGIILRIYELPDSYDAYIDSLNDVISGKNRSKYDILISNEHHLVFEIIKDNKIKFSIITDFMFHNPDNKYLKPLMEFTINHDDCVDALKSLRDNIIKNIDEN
jgi:hypothetical protein